MAGLISKADRIKGSLLAGAIGDALGAAVEFQDLASIRQRFGREGIRDYAPAYGRLGAITDDTQMTLFTAEGLLRATDADARPASIRRAYLRWLETQGEGELAAGDASGWLMSLSALHARRAPGNTCLSALRTGRAGTTVRPINGSKGCGGVMRVAPVGLALADPKEAFELACAVAAITHGHPSGYLTAGVLASVIVEIMVGVPLSVAIERSLPLLTKRSDGGETERAVRAALAEAERGRPCAESVARLGEGWVAEEALAIGLYSVLATEVLEDAITLAVNHSGDSDSTGSIAGNIAGALYGPSAIPERWLTPLELRNEIERIGDDLYRQFHGRSFEPLDRDFARYPKG